MPADVGYTRIWVGELSATGSAVRVFTGDGKPVGAQVLWAEEGEPLKVLFDTADRAPTYVAYVGGDPVPADAAPWQPPAGLVLETRPCTNATPATLVQMEAQWRGAAPVFGRSMVLRVYDGLHHHGPSTNFLSRYEGFLQIPADGTYEFATLSDNASFVLLDGHVVVEWGGEHWAGGGLYGEHSGKVQLTAGRHALVYYHAHGAGDAVAALAWKQPGRPRFEIVPPEAFAPAAKFRVADMASQSGQPRVMVEWDPIEYASAGDVTLITMEFRARGAGGVDGAYWSFDDGTRADGAVVRHVFARGGLQTVRLEAMPKGGQATRFACAVRVHPRWLQEAECPWDVVERQKQALLGYDLAALGIRDLAAAIVFADTVQERVWAATMGEVLLRRRGELNAAQAEAVYRLALPYQNAEIRRYDQAELAFRTVFDLGAVRPPILSLAHLHYAGFLVHVLARPEEADRHLLAVRAEDLSTIEARLLDTYTADAALAAGQVDRARGLYAAMGAVGENADQAYYIRRRARLEQATDLLTRGEYNDVELIARGIEWERPLERMGTRTGFLLAQAFMGQKAYPLALGRCLLIQKAKPPEDYEPQLLYYMIEIYQAMGQKANASRCCQQLLHDHPHSEAAARAKDKFPGL